MLRGVIGTPMRRIDLANSVLALAEPEPLTLANLTTKSLTRWRPVTRSANCNMRAPPVPHREGSAACPTRQWGTARRTGRSAGKRPRPSPSRGRSSVRRRRRGPASRCAPARSAAAAARASSPFSVKLMQSTGQMSTQASHSMHSASVNTVCTSQFRQRCASAKASLSSKPSSTSALMSCSAIALSRCGTLKRRSSEMSLS